MNKDRKTPLKEIGLRKPPVAFLMCLLFTVLAWFSINLSKEYTQTLSYSISCYDLPENTKEVSLSDSTLFITVKTKGFNYLKPSFSDKRRVVNLSITALTNQKSPRRAYSFDKNILEEYIRENEIIGSGFIAIEHPERFTLYLK